MSDDESMTDTSQPPSLEDANLDDVSSDASAVSDGSASFSINTDDEDSDDDSDADVELRPHGGGSDDDDLGATFVVPLKTGSDHDIGESPRTAARMQRRRSVEDRDTALEKNSLRRQASNNTLLAMRAATQAVSSEESEDTANENVPRRCPPPRTKSGGVFAGAVQVAEVEGLEGEQDLNEEGERRRRPPPRTKSGEGMPGAALPPRRRPPPRSKSGKAGEGLLARDPSVSETRGNEQTSYHMSLNIEGSYALGSDADGMLMSPPGRRTRRDREQILSINAVRRQASNDQLRAMQDAARQVHGPGISRAKSSAAVVQRRPPARSMSGEGFAPNIVVDGEENAAPDRRRRPPPRTKSGEGLQEGEGNATRRRPPARTKSGGVFAVPPSIPTIQE